MLLRIQQIRHVRSQLGMISNEVIKKLLWEAIKYTKIFSLNPEYWKVEVLIPDTPITLSLGSSKELLNFKERGKLIFLYSFCDNKDAVLEVFIDDMRMRGTPKEVYNAGLVGYNPVTYWIAEYDDVNNRYVIMYTPVPPREYYGRIYAKFYAPREKSVNFKYVAVRYKFLGD